MPMSWPEFPTITIRVRSCEGFDEAMDIMPKSGLVDIGYLDHAFVFEDETGADAFGILLTERGILYEKER